MPESFANSFRKHVPQQHYLLEMQFFVITDSNKMTMSDSNLNGRTNMKIKYLLPQGD